MKQHSRPSRQRDHWVSFIAWARQARDFPRRFSLVQLWGLWALGLLLLGWLVFRG